MHEVVLKILFFIFRILFQLIFQIVVEWIFDYLPKKFFGYPFHEKDDELIQGKIYLLEKELWFEPYKIYTLEMFQRKSIRKLIVKLKMLEIQSNEEKRNEFLSELDRRLFDLNPIGIRNRKTSPN
ncbi:hypothetical protein AN960_15250 [Bacillus sp. FJAT-25509]|uniref:hypothetical protein n=1 Tax=Bacillaceae TaxID=186817 RepID=UPI0006F3A2D2|nr:hypothetical protein [Bacillus sp. FJAT-25509]KQL37906.1 hypothetical protein AN960_15250 [Bacillus sp. FJAT-25509]